MYVVPEFSADPSVSRPRFLLALESSTSQGGVALLREGVPVGQAALAAGLRHGRELLPAAAGLLERVGLVPAALWGVAVSAGPGSYTGTRVGVMAAKALAYGIGGRLIAVSSLAVLAAGLGTAIAGGLVMIAVEARRDELYVGLYRIEEGDVRPLAADAALAPEEARERLAELRRTGENVRLAGSGFSAYPELFAGLGGREAGTGWPDPAVLGRLGWRRLLGGGTADPLLLQPTYLRRDSAPGWARDRLIASGPE
ncbi:MAG: tRNA (adenosine(37)-N6)-threonylcarbamoyltransferase complex dimerization subunit type 1 TsaB [Planctomycetota bacterium]|jgi:tRNA threonylcarbamoyladenosine biosynthesis protein TsaB|nr:tRNA (adenosine(37)-N6)-threonylcarbamoyltransferase complex dimerization subunit type 1 TsaB [Planctomycetota bacterium]